MPHQVLLAAADGSTAAIAIHKAFLAHQPSARETRRRSARDEARISGCVR